MYIYTYIHVYILSLAWYFQPCVAIHPPDPMNHAKIFKAGPPEMPLRSWYLSGTQHFRPTILVGWK